MAWYHWPLLFGLALLLTGCWRGYALSRALLDVPNERSSHQVPTPRGGGVAIVTVFFLGTLLLYHHALISGVVLWIALVGALLVAGIGALDDRRHVSPAARLLVHCMACALLLALPDTANLLPSWATQGWLSLLVRLVLLLALIWLVNLYNFMDGIDGIAAAEAICVALGAMLLLHFRGVENAHIQWLAVLLAASCGFLWWNWPPAKIFMGDAGSGFFGYIFGFFAILTSSSSTLSLWSWVILLGVFITDASVTLLRRILRGEPCAVAHRGHGYQILARRLGTHGRVTLGVVALNGGWLLPLAMAAIVWPDMAMVWTLIAYCPLIVFAWRIGAGSING